MTNENSHPSGNQFVLQRIYATVSSEVPNIPAVFESSEAPNLDVKLEVKSEAINSNIGNHKVALTVVVTAKQENKTLFLVEVTQGGLFAIQGFTETELTHIVNVSCPALLYPYASALISDLVLRAGFMPLHLPPVDFNAMYEQKKQDASA